MPQGITHRATRAGGRRLASLLFLLVIFCVFANAAQAACPNEALRGGPSANLPDCRAYELVTPANTDGRDPARPVDPNLRFNLFPFPLFSPVRDSLLFVMSGTPLHEPPGASGVEDVYRTERFVDGWRTVSRMSPSGEEARLPNPGGFSSDQLYYFSQVRPVGGTLAGDGDISYLGNPDGSFEILGVGSLGSEPRARGRYISPGGEHIIFSTDESWCLGAESCDKLQLEPEAAPSGTTAIYDRSPDGPTRVVSVLGQNTPLEAGENAAYQGVSADGSTVAFTVEGKLYVRRHDSFTAEVPDEGATFAGLSADGSILFYLSGNDVFRFDVDGEEATQLTTSGNASIVTVSADGSTVYFLSSSQINDEGTAEEPNLYVWSSRSNLVSLVATVASADLEGTPALGNWTAAVSPEAERFVNGPGITAARTNPEGSVLAFMSRRELTGYPNEGHVEIYRFESDGGGLECVSCNPTGTPAAFDARFEQPFFISTELVMNNLSDDGSNVFFETTEALADGDQDGTNDVYESQRGSTGSEVDLISSGQSPVYESLFGPLENDRLFSISPDGQDVIFASRDTLVPAVGKGGVPALFDARAGGGFAEPPIRQVCTGESCQVSSAAIPGSAAQSDHFRGKGNVRPRRHRCKRRAHQHRAERRQVCRRHKKGHRRQTNVSREAGGVTK